MTKYLISLPFIFLSIIITSCCNEDSFLIEESSPKEICLQTDEIKISEISYNDSILSNRLDQINDSVLQICNTLYKDEKPNHPQVLSLNGAEIITADAQGFYAGFKYGWSKGKTIFGKISTAAACAAIKSVVMSAAAAVIELGFGYLDYITSYNKGMPRITYSIENSYNDA